MSEDNNGRDHPADDNQQDVQASSAEPQQEKIKVYVRGQGLGTTVDKELLTSVFTRFGEVKDVFIAGGGRGYAFIEFARRDDAEAAIRDLHQQEVNGVRLEVEMARQPNPGSRTRTEFGTKPGDWACPQCRVNNFARRDQCFRCGTPKPMGGGGGGYDDRRRGRGRSRDRDDRRPAYDDRRGGGGGYDDRRAGYDDRRGGGGGGYDDRRGPDRGYDRAPERGYDRGYDRGAYDRGGYDRAGYVDDRRAPPPQAAPASRGRSKSR